jgi:23S rRNA (cytidine1920-2'-O)/16S rRNA (cytidine1409-2'-O)-methyltransferase
MGLAKSRKRAQALIMSGKVFVDGQKATKAGIRIKPHQQVVLKEPDHPYVSRGGLKLERVLKQRPDLFSGLRVMDVGASTGGFTDCLLRYGAEAVVAVDVGYGQLDWKLRTDPRVDVLERTNIRHVKSRDLPFRPQGAVIDVSFISLRIVLPVVVGLIEQGSPVVALIKPQFELDRQSVGKKGVVGDPEKRRRAVDSVVELAGRLRMEVSEVVCSPIRGPKGNEEFLMVARTPHAAALDGKGET